MSDTIAKIDKYFSGTSRYPLLVVVSADEYLDVLSAYSNMPKIKVSDYCVGADKEPDIENLKKMSRLSRETAYCLDWGIT